MQAAGGGEDRLRGADRVGQAQHHVEGDGGRIVDRRDPAADGGDALLAAEAAGGGGAQDAAGGGDRQRPAGRGRHLDDVVAVAAGGRRALDERGHLVERGDHAFGEEQAGREVEIVARRPHRDQQALAADADLERLLGDHLVAVGGEGARGPRLPPPLDGTLDGARAGLRPDRQRGALGVRAGLHARMNILIAFCSVSTTPQSSGSPTASQASTSVLFADLLSFWAMVSLPQTVAWRAPSPPSGSVCSK